MTKKTTTRFAAALAAFAFAGMAHAAQNTAEQRQMDQTRSDLGQQSQMRTDASEATAATDPSRSKAATYVDDAAITAKVKSKFAEDSQVRATAISVETRNGVVSLSGNARSDVEKTRAEEIARDTQGAKDVSNRIIVR